MQQHYILRERYNAGSGPEIFPVRKIILKVRTETDTQTGLSRPEVLEIHISNIHVT